MGNPLLYTIGDEIVDILANIKDDRGNAMFSNVVNGFVVPENSRPVDFPLACVFYSDGSFEGDIAQLSTNITVGLNIIGYFHIIDPQIAQLTMMEFHSKVSKAIIDRVNDWEHRFVTIKLADFGFGDVLRRNFGITEIPLMPPFYGVHINLSVEILQSYL